MMKVIGETWIGLEDDVGFRSAGQSVDREAEPIGSDGGTRIVGWDESPY